MTNAKTHNQALHCFMCSNKISSAPLSYNDIGWTTNEQFLSLKIYFCSFCTFAFAFPELNPEDIHSYYAEQYRSPKSTFYINFNKKVIPEINDLYNNRSFAQLTLARSFCTFDHGDSFLDIGPGKGGSFIIANAIFPAPALHAIELSKEADEYYKKNFNTTSHLSLTNFSKGERKAKIILMSHSLEHFCMSDLDILFKNIQTALHDEGVLVIEVPNVNMQVHQYVRGPDTPHLLFFTPKSLKALLIKYKFKVLFIDTCGPLYNLKKHESSVHPALLKKIFNNMPHRIQIYSRTIVRFFRLVWKYIQKPLELISRNSTSTTLPNHSYGGERKALRLIAKVDHE
ncbi:MAG: class I SAM-dependent methyltransferase [Bdellovibrionales bacterium]|jgi:hypothetical protein|nr:class I SAM-dependent methyltransferase [Bdellovibrionales bacterium]MBT3525224.1 class I SAM-dependent methyltransferase [Bdellovibrionales bacterium]MBT7668250.1 class I SAM-dependent methyltransferase [Bdellovibrionales bacterium]